MIVVASNRTVNEQGQDQNLFNAYSATQTFDELLFAQAQAESESAPWNIQLVTPSDDPAVSRLPHSASSPFEAWSQDGRPLHWVLYVHGYNQSFKDSLDASRAIAQRYNVGVIAFSWPANPDGFAVDVEKYRNAQKAARESAAAFFKLLASLKQSLQASAKTNPRNKPASFNLLIHSLGNLILETLVRDDRFTDQTGIFDNIILHQADVENETHTEWIDKLSPSRVYVTINAFDLVLEGSDFINRARLGSSRKNLDATHPIYLDFTHAKNVEKNHNFFAGERDVFSGDHKNAKIYHVFRELLQGRPGETPKDFFDYIEEQNIFRLRAFAPVATSAK